MSRTATAPRPQPAVFVEEERNGRKDRTQSPPPPVDPLAAIADALEAAAQEAEEELDEEWEDEGQDDAAAQPAARSQPGRSAPGRSAPGRSAPAGARAVPESGLSQAVYTAAYGVGYGVAFPALFLFGLLPQDSSVARGIRDGARAALDSFEE